MRWAVSRIAVTRKPERASSEPGRPRAAYSLNYFRTQPVRIGPGADVGSKELGPRRSEDPTADASRARGDRCCPIGVVWAARRDCDILVQFGLVFIFGVLYVEQPQNTNKYPCQLDPFALMGYLASQAYTPVPRARRTPEVAPSIRDALVRVPSQSYIAASRSVRSSLVEAPQFAAPAAFPLGQQLRQLAVEAAAVLEVDRRLDGIGEQVQGMHQAQ